MAKKLSSEVAKREAGKSQANIGDIRQMIKIVSDVFAEEMAENKGSPGPLFDGFIKKVNEKYGKLATRKARVSKKTATALLRGL